MAIAAGDAFFAVDRQFTMVKLGGPITKGVLDLKGEFIGIGLVAVEAVYPMAEFPEAKVVEFGDGVHESIL